MHPAHDFRAIFFINAQHFAQGEHGQPFGKICHQIDLAVVFACLGFHFVEEAVDLPLNAHLQAGNIIGCEKRPMRHSQRNMKRLIHVNHGVQCRRTQALRTRRFFAIAHQNAACARGKSFGVKIAFFDILMARQRPETGYIYILRRLPPGDRGLSAQFVEPLIGLAVLGKSHQIHQVKTARCFIFYVRWTVAVIFRFNYVRKRLHGDSPSNFM